MAARLGHVLYVLGLIIASPLLLASPVALFYARPDDRLFAVAVLTGAGLAIAGLGYACRYVLAGPMRSADSR